MVLGLISRLAGRQPATKPSFDAPISPNRVVYAVGDVHGRLDLLDRLLDRIEADREAVGATDAPLVFVGDYVDRGEASREVLERLRTLSAGASDVRCLLGNHEAMMLEFVDGAPERRARWLRAGGLQTLASFGVGGVTETAEPEAMEMAANRLAEAAGPELLAWIRDLPTREEFGNVHIVHAGADPDLPMAAQSERTLIWGHPRFAETPRSDGQWVVHGHTVTDVAEASGGRVAIDTGAWFSGRLTAVRLRQNEAVFLTT